VVNGKFAKEFPDLCHLSPGQVNVKWGDKNINCFTGTLETVSEQQELCCSRECTEKYSTFFDSQVLDSALCISVSLPEDKFGFLIYKYIRVLTERNMG
jgi:hypothetical protein